MGVKGVENEDITLGAIHRDCAGSRGYEEMARCQGVSFPAIALGHLALDAHCPLKMSWPGGFVSVRRAAEFGQERSSVHEECYDDTARFGLQQSSAQL